MKTEFYKLYLRLLWYAFFLGITGGIASFVGPPHHIVIKIGIGMVFGAMLLGNRLPSALKELWDSMDDISDELFPE